MENRSKPVKYKTINVGSESEENIIALRKQEKYCATYDRWVEGQPIVKMDLTDAKPGMKYKKTKNTKNYKIIIK